MEAEYVSCNVIRMILGTQTLINKSTREDCLNTHSDASKYASNTFVFDSLDSCWKPRSFNTLILKPMC